MAFREIAVALADGGRCLDCGADDGSSFETIHKSTQLDKTRYYGIEWNGASVLQARRKGLNVVQGDLNSALPFSDDHFRCVFGLSSLENLLNGCAFMKECRRVLEKAGKLVVLTPNISTFFTVALLLIGKMPSSGPHPDSNALLDKKERLKVDNDSPLPDAELEKPAHRHLVVFSYRVLRQYLVMIGFTHVQGYGFGLYPFPGFMQPVLERIDPYHCHQMVFVATKWLLNEVQSKMRAARVA
ncbi:MAG: methionine biosynthesis protein MetW [Desulfobacterota bacterium]|nr:methionine biosynthesis protein MetW [Thermodesulfobacteriota bacterium]